MTYFGSLNYYKNIKNKLEQKKQNGGQNGRQA
jgi:hypothetical protein